MIVPPPYPSDCPIRSIQDIQHVFYINLERRTDRKKHVEQQLERIGFRNEAVQRFNAICPANGNGAIGCTMSHLRCLQTAKDNGWPHVCIVEDDIEFTQPDVFIEQMNTFLTNHTAPREWDVVILSGNNVPPYRVVDSTCIQVSKCQTTTGYLIQNHYFDALINNIREGLVKFMKEPHLGVMYAIDKYWFQLQGKDRWFLIIPLTVFQREDYSDIEKRHTNYKSLMADLDKPHLFSNKPASHHHFLQRFQIHHPPI